MKNKIPTIAWIIVMTTAIFAVCYYIINKRNAEVSSNIINYCNKNESIKQIKLEDFTNFDWDKVVVYSIPASQDDIASALGFDYDVEDDLTAGMIFIKGKKVVYEETFKTDYESPYKFVIHPSKDSKLEVTKFRKADAAFDIKRIVYNGENRYVLQPTKSIFIDYDNYNNTETPKSYFQHFEVVDNVAKIYCHLTIFNNESVDSSFIIRAKSAEDVGKLLKDGSLTVKDDNTEKIFEIKANETLKLDIIFEGSYGGTYEKADRLLPKDIQIIEIN